MLWFDTHTRPEWLPLSSKLVHERQSFESRLTRWWITTVKLLVWKTRPHNILIIFWTMRKCSEIYTSTVSVYQQCPSNTFQEGNSCWPCLQYVVRLFSTTSCYVMGTGKSDFRNSSCLKAFSKYICKTCTLEGKTTLPHWNRILNVQKSQWDYVVISWTYAVSATLDTTWRHLWTKVNYVYQFTDQ